MNLPDADSRLRLLAEWLASALHSTEFTLAPASADASFRRYFRVTLSAPNALSPSAATLVVMDAPPPKEDCRPFVQVAALLRAAGINAPQILSQDIERGFLLLTDLGPTTYLRALTADNADELFQDAVDTLLRWQLASQPDVLPSYDEALLRRELELFPEWYVGRHLGQALTDVERSDLSRVFDLLIASNLAQPTVYVHRDYMPRNLMVSVPNPGVLDFQDAVQGPITYDIASLFRDAFISWPDECILDWTIRYWEKARRAGLPANADFAQFHQDCEWMGLQRHLKVLGIFARIHHRDGKSGYVEDTPRFLDYVRPVARRYRELAPLARLLDRLEKRTATVGYTF